MKQICDLLKSLKEMGRTVIVVTYDAELIKGCCSYVVRLKGKYVVDEMEEIKAVVGANWWGTQFSIDDIDLVRRKSEYG